MSKPNSKLNSENNIKINTNYLESNNILTPINQNHLNIKSESDIINNSKNKITKTLTVEDLNANITINKSKDKDKNTIQTNSNSDKQLNTHHEGHHHDKVNKSMTAYE